jgi:tRNA 2-selenouridine synthase
MKEFQHAGLAGIDAFDEIIDVRSPAEYTLDRIPGAANCPVLDNAERARVGTAYKQVSPFVARKMGAALVARNIAHHLEARFASRESGWRPLVYCWRGGKRSEAMAHILREVGWKAMTLQGGYQQYRRDLLAAMESLPGRLCFQVVCGPTGSGKSRLLRALAARDAQVLDLEALACHRGSLLGDIPGDPQPSQKMFESLVWDMLRRFDPGQPVFVEAESARIGALRVPAALHGAMRAGEAIVLEVPLEARVGFLLQEYRHLLDDAGWLKHKLLRLAELHSRRTVAQWIGQVDAGDWEALVGSLLAAHYDPAYRRSLSASYPAASRTLRLDDLAPASLDDLARALAGAGTPLAEAALAR